MAITSRVIVAQYAIITFNRLTSFVLLSIAVVQLSVTIGIMLAYLLGLFVEWRILAVLGNHIEH